jgi:predicted permease
MNRFRELGRQLSMLFHRRRFDSELDEEMRLHRELREQELIDATVPPGEARLMVRRRFGNPAVLREESRDMWGWNWLEHTVQDVRYGLRMLMKSPGFTGVAILSLGLGIGANTAIFTLINNVMLKSLPVRDPEQLVSFGKAEGGGILAGLEGPIDIFSYDFYRRIENQYDAFSGLCALGSFSARVGVRSGASSAQPASQGTVQLVSGTYFSVLGVNTVLGRAIDPSDTDAPGRQAVATISYYYWQRMFSGSPGVIGQTISINETPFTVIGVAPPKFYGVALEADPPDMWVPLTMQEQVMLQPSLLGPNGLYWLHLIGRPKHGINVKQAQEWVSVRLRQYMTTSEGAELTADRRQEIEKSFVELLPAGRGMSHLRSTFSDSLRVLMGVVMLVLLIACSNLVNFLLSKTAAREREISTRLALGAGRWRIIRQMLTEALLMSFFGGALGLICAYWGASFLLSFVAAGATRMPFDATPDLSVLGFTFAVSIATGLLFGLGPALRVSRASLASGMKSGVRTLGRGTGRSGGALVPKILIASQVALSLVLVAGAGLLVRTLQKLETQSFGFNRRNVLLVNFDARIAGYKPEKLTHLYQQILDRLNVLPGVASAAVSAFPPIVRGSWQAPISIQGYLAQPHEDLHTKINAVGPRYFETLGTPVLKGRSIGPQDIGASAKVAVVNQTLANRFFPGGSAIGQRASLPGVDGQFEIVGVVGDSKESSPSEVPDRLTYLPLMQMSDDNLYANCLELRTVGEPAAITADVRSVLARIDSNLPITDVITMTEHLDRLMVQEELISQLSGFFSLLALLLACIGVYGVMTYNVLRRVNEIGIRMALGAESGKVLRMVLKESLMLLGVGVAAGIPATVAATRLIKGQLFGVSATDPSTIITAVVLVAAVTVLSGYLPARRAARVDPMVALRYE